MVFAHRVACVKPRFLKNIQKLSKINEFYENSDFGNSEKHTKTQAKSRVFRGTINFRKPNLAKIRKTTDTFFLQFSLKGAAHSVSLGLRQLLLRRAVLGGGLPPEIAEDINQLARSSHSPRPPTYLPSFPILHSRMIRTSRHTTANIASSHCGRGS